MQTKDVAKVQKTKPCEVPPLKLLLNRMATYLGYLILPVPVVLLRFAFSLHLSTNTRISTRRMRRDGEAARGAAALLEVEAPAAAPHALGVCVLFLRFPELAVAFVYVEKGKYRKNPRKKKSHAPRHEQIEHELIDLASRRMSHLPFSGGRSTRRGATQRRAKSHGAEAKGR